MADEYIKRAAVLKFIQDGLNRKDRSKAFGYDAVEIMTEVQYMPSADVVERKRGEWVQVICHVEFEDGFVDRLYECCSRCHKPNGRRTSDFCPNCGADMRGESDANDLER